MKLSVFFWIIAFNLCTLTAFAQNDSTILRIGKYQFPAGEFWHIFNKNKNLPGFNETPVQFADRFINYKLKVVEAIQQGLDTLPEFITEYTKYRDELANSYLLDSAALEQAALEAYTNMRKMVNASHILIRLPQNPTPNDTLKAWQKISSLREMILNGADFNQTALQYSEDPSARQNQGQLGYFTTFQMVYPFEKAAFATPQGELSPIVRTLFGYHLIKVHNIVPNPGKIRIAHIMKMFNGDPSPETDARAKASIDSLYQKLQNGADFAELARLHSDDQQSAVNGGEMRPFGLNEIVPEFATAAFNLENDAEYSKPVRTAFGWHIIKRLELQPIEDYKVMQPAIMSMMTRDERGLAGQKQFVERKRNSDHFKFNNEVWNTLLQPFSAELSNNEAYFSQIKNTESVIFNYFNSSVTTAQFTEHLKKQPDFSVKVGITALEQALDYLISETIIKTEKERLPLTNNYFRYLSNEYYDGLLIFELSNREIWSKADADSAALHNYYLNHPAEFTEPATLNGVLCFSENKTLIKKISKKLKKDPNTSLDSLLAQIKASKEDYQLKHGSFAFVDAKQNPVKTESLPESNPFFNTAGSVFWQGGISQGVLTPFNNCKGLVISNYQNFLEKQWVESLKARHNPEFNFKVLKQSSPKAK